MFHFARVGPIDLGRLKTDNRGWGCLDFTINGRPHRIRWHPKHAETVRNATSR
jgi:hypothetical protein